jgi:MoxR-like ATPase
MENIKIDFAKADNLKFETKPQNYILSKELKSAIEVAISLGQPLLLTGEPGTGKTQLAYKIALDASENSESFNPNPLVFNTKTTSNATDLFYTYDAIRHFHDANLKKSENSEINSNDYITLQALGKAIALTTPLDNKIVRNFFLRDDKNKMQSSVVLIDEIDKAPRDFPNDILNEIETFEFEIKEADNLKISKGKNHHILIIMTSNSEKNLPEAFLRRCIFFHIPFPDKHQLAKIILSQLGESTPYKNEIIIDFFLDIRESLSKKKPATAELISWLKILEQHNFLINKEIDFKNLTNDQKNILNFSFSVLAKTKEDIIKLRENFNI